MIKDGLGNTLFEGNLVYVQSQHIPPIGKVIAIREGGLSLPNQKGTTPTVMVIGFELTITAQPDAVVGAVIRVVDPRSEAVIASILEMPKPKITEN